MSDHRLPKGIRPIVSKGYSMTLGNNVYRSSVGGGAPRQGMDQAYDTVPISITLICTGWQDQAMAAFLKAIDNGGKSFIMQHDLGHGLRDYQTWITSTINRNSNDGQNWYYAFTATCEALYDPCEDLLYETLAPMYECLGSELVPLLRQYAYDQSHFPRVYNPLQEQFVLVGDIWYFYDRNGILTWWGPELEQGVAA